MATDIERSFYGCNPAESLGDLPTSVGGVDEAGTCTKPDGQRKGSRDRGKESGTDEKGQGQTKKVRDRGEESGTEEKSQIQQCPQESSQGNSLQNTMEDGPWLKRDEDLAPVPQLSARRAEGDCAPSQELLICKNMSACVHRGPIQGRLAARCPQGPCCTPSYGSKVEGQARQAFRRTQGSTDSHGPGAGGTCICHSVQDAPARE